MKRSEWAAHAGAVTLSVATLVLALVPLPAAALTQEQIDWCINENHTFLADGQVMGCTAAIQSDKWRGKDLAWAFNNRGYAYAGKGEYDRAIEDYDQAILLNPNYAMAYNNRGYAYNDKGDYDRAIDDFDQAIRLDPNLRLPYYKRGVAYFEKRDYDRAIADFARRSGSIRTLPSRTTNAASPMPRKRRTRPRHRRLRPGDPARSEIRSAYNNRGLACAAKGDDERAIADLARPSGSTPSTRPPTTIAASLYARATTTARSPT